MKINKQLFEDVLSGKLKGTFVLRDGKKIESKCLRKNYSSKFCYCFTNEPYPFTCNGYTRIQNIPDEDDVIDFIVDGIDPEMYLYNKKDVQFIEHFIKGNHMKENELTIEIPDGKIVDWDESKKQNKIVLKDKPLTYESICEKLLSEKSYFITNESTIHPTFEKNQIFASNCAFTQHQLECILAKNKLANVAVYLNNGWKPVFSDDLRVFVIYNYHEDNILQVDNENSLYAKDMGHIIFKTRELAQQAIKILGEETIKLALEPLGI